jgi:glycosyltransferase involved in cell wall biosynthesis
MTTNSRLTPKEVTIVAQDIGPVGGMERQLTELIKGLRRLGYQITVIARTCDLELDEGIEFHRIRGPRRPFVIAYPWFMLAGSLVVRRRRRGLVQATGAIVFNRVDSMAIHYCHQAGVSTPSRGTRLFHWHAKMAEMSKRMAERMCLRPGRVTAIVCVSPGVAQEIQDHYPRMGSSVVTIPNGVDTELFSPGLRAAEASSLRVRLGIPNERLVAAFVGGEWQRKGLAAVIAALVEAPMWTLVVAGSGDEHSYRELAEELGVSESVRWLGVVRDMPVIYELADAFVLPSSYETFSLVTYEAASSGLPLLATPVNGVRDLLRDGENGLFIDQDSASVAAGLMLLAQDPALRVRMGENAREAALGFGWEVMVTKHEEIYLRLASDQV